MVERKDMIFSIYTGSKEEPDTGSGAFTKGRLYLAIAKVDDEVIDLTRLRLKDDLGEDIVIEPENGRFKYPEEVYGVMLKVLGSRMPGEVVVIDDADDDGFLSIKGMGFVRAVNIQLLDSTLVKPGMMVYDRKRTVWDKIQRVDECMRIQVEGLDEMRPCEDFVFSVSDGDLAVVPLLKCLDDEGVENVQKGSVYRVRGLDDAGNLIVENDAGEDVSFSPERFEFV
jgi:hypothetical protein